MGGIHATIRTSTGVSTLHDESCATTARRRKTDAGFSRFGVNGPRVTEGPVLATYRTASQVVRSTDAYRETNLPLRLHQILGQNSRAPRQLRRRGEIPAMRILGLAHE